MYILEMPCIFKKKEVRMNIKLFGNDKFIATNELSIPITINESVFKSVKFKSCLKLSLRIHICLNNKDMDHTNNTSVISASSLNTSNLSNRSLNTSGLEGKKITIKDLCAEEKAKIGDLLKKLADEKEEKERLRQIADDEKKLYESRIDSLVKEKYVQNILTFRESISILTTSRYEDNNSMLRTESFMENIPAESKKEPAVGYADIKYLKDRFNQMFENVKKSVTRQEELSFRLNNTSLLDSSNQLLKEDKPMSLDYKPIDKIVADRTNLDILQTSILNINDEIRDGNFLFSDRSFESHEDVFSTSASSKRQCVNPTTMRLNMVKERLIRENNNDTIVNTTNRFSESSSMVGGRQPNAYKDMLGRIREKSKDIQIREVNNRNADSSDSDDHELHKIARINKNNLNTLTNTLIKREELSIVNLDTKTNKVQPKLQTSFSQLKLSTNNAFEIKARPLDSYEVTLTNSRLNTKQSDDNDIIDLLSSINLSVSRGNNRLKQSTFEDDEYSHIDDNIFDIIEGIDSKPVKSVKPSETKYSESMGFNYEAEKQ
jgi:hypothetical protein